MEKERLRALWRRRRPLRRLRRTESASTPPATTLFYPATLFPEPHFPDYLPAALPPAPRSAFLRTDPVSLRPNPLPKMHDEDLEDEDLVSKQRRVDEKIRSEDGAKRPGWAIREVGWEIGDIRG